MLLKIAFVVVLWIVVGAGLWWWGRHWTTQRRSRERMFEQDDPETPLGMQTVPYESAGFLTRWLFRAGYRQVAAAPVFVTITAVMLLVGLTTAWTMAHSDLLKTAAGAVAYVPGGIGDLLLPVTYLAPWILLLILGSMPALMVRAARRQRVQQAEQDLPIVLELLATLSEAGLGFDAALERILQAQPAQRFLTQEFRTFQMEIMAGRPRIQSLRRLSWRLDVMSLTIFVSALVQTEQVGAGVADVLRRQADDLRGRRREHALGQAAAIPVKLLFPLVICFLPGILVATLGPTFYQIFQFLEGLTRARGAP